MMPTTSDAFAPTTATSVHSTARAKLFPRELYARAADALEWLARTPVVLVAMLLAMNAVISPYAGIAHDASVYSLQALNRSTAGAFAGDLFLKYGSQDRFSVFGPIAAPAIRLMGVRPAFYVFFVLSAGLLIYAMLRLNRALLRDPAMAAAGTIVAAINPLWYGGLWVFRVNESFFTPRLPACGFVLLGLEQLITGRFWWSLALLFAAALLHPLMALGGLVIWGLWMAGRLPSAWRWAVYGAAGAAASRALANRTISSQLLARIDEPWREIVWRAAPYNFTTEWLAANWMAVIASCSIVAVAAWLFRKDSPAAATLLALTTVAAVGGLFLTMAAPRVSNALLFQMQPYRALWLPTVLQWPLSIWLAARAFRSQSLAIRLGAIAIAWYVMTSTGLFEPYSLVVAIAACIVSVALDLRAKGRLTQQVVVRGAMIGLIFGVVFRVAVSATAMAVLALDVLKPFDPIAYSQVVIQSFGPALWVAAVGFGMYLSRRWRDSSRFVALFLLAFSFVVNASAVLATESAPYQTAFHPERRELEAVRAYLDREWRSGDRPTVYSDWGRTSDLWIDLRAKSYFSLTQVVGVMFSRDTALEAMRRARVVAPFERRRVQRSFEPQSIVSREMLDRLFPQSDSDTVGRTDVMNLCADESLDIALLWASRGADPRRGGVDIYDCRRIRLRAASTRDTLGEFEGLHHE